jgi:heme-degrading monooxygenase HmoA
MVISLTRSAVTPDQAEQVEAFLAGFLPRLKADQPGVIAAYHYATGGELVTVIVWVSEDARLAYRASDLIKEPIAMETRLGMNTVREAYPITLAV